VAVRAGKHAPGSGWKNCAAPTASAECGAEARTPTPSASQKGKQHSIVRLDMCVVVRILGSRHEPNEMNPLPQKSQKPAG